MPPLIVSHRPTPPDNPLPLLRHGAIEAIELIPWGSNYTFAALVNGEDGSSCLAVYKPRRGEVPLRDFPSGTLYKREVAAYLLAHHLGWTLVPATIIREQAPHGIGSLQFYVEPQVGPAARFDRLLASHRRELQRMALFDLLTNNADRKGGHCLLDVHGQVWGIDHGLTFHHVPKLRTIIWEFAGEPIPDDFMEALAAVRADPVRVDVIRHMLAPLLSAGELRALFDRWDRLLAAPCYPDLDPYRNVPWPPF